jgi:hypothetical protein
MSLLSWFRRNGQPSSSPRLDQLIYRVVGYLKSRPSDDEILPKIVGKAIGESEISVATVMRILEDRGVAKHHFGVYCGKTHVHLASLDDRPLPPSSIYCEVCDEDHCHAEEDCKVEVYYTIDEEKLAVFSLHISAA